MFPVGREGVSIDENGAYRALQDYHAGRTRPLSEYLEELRQRCEWQHLGQESLQKRFDQEPW